MNTSDEEAGEKGHVNLKPTVALITATHERLTTRPRFQDIRVTQTSTTAATAQIRHDEVQIIFFNSLTMRCMSYRRDLVAMVPQSFYSTLYKVAIDAFVGDVIYDGERYYVCADYGEKPVFQPDVITSAMKVVVDHAVQNTPNGRSTRLFYISSGEDRWAVKHFAFLEYPDLYLSHYNLALKRNQYEATDDPTKHVTKTGVKKEVAASLRGEVAIERRYQDLTLERLNPHDVEDVLDEETSKIQAATGKAQRKSEH